MVCFIVFDEIFYECNTLKNASKYLVPKLLTIWPIQVYMAHDHLNRLYSVYNSLVINNVVFNPSNSHPRSFPLAFDL